MDKAIIEKDLISALCFGFDIVMTPFLYQIAMGHIDRQKIEDLAEVLHNQLQRPMPAEWKEQLEERVDHFINFLLRKIELRDWALGRTA